MNSKNGKFHHYKATIRWTGDKGLGTSYYNAYEREHKIIIGNKIDIHGSSDPVFKGDPSKHNPEDLFLFSLSACHMLWYLHLCSQAGVVVKEYIDEATGIMHETENGGGKFSEVSLNPIVTVTESAMKDKAYQLHHEANRFCFIANSVNFPIYHHPQIKAIG